MEADAQRLRNVETKVTDLLQELQDKDRVIEGLTAITAQVKTLEEDARSVEGQLKQQVSLNTQLRVALGIALALALVVAWLLVVNLVPLQWVVRQPHKWGIEAGVSVFLIVGTLGFFHKGKRNYWWGSAGLGVVLVIVGFL